MFENFTWRNIVLFVVALAVTSCLMAGGVILAVERLLYANWDRETGTPKAQPVKIERPTI
jgi:hypothetical protein